MKESVYACTYISKEAEEGITHVGYSQLETADGYVSTPREMELFKQGKFRLWLCDYTFAVEKRVVAPLTAEDFAGITTHQGTP